MKKKVKRFFLVLVFLVPLLYFAFTVLFFSPFEEPFGPVEYVIPRDVDFFLSKSELTDDFADFPRPRFYVDLKVNREWREFSESSLFKDITGGRDPDERISEIQDALRDVPVDPLADVLGRQVAVAGTFDFDSDEMPLSYLVFFRGSWKAKLFYELLTWDILRGLAPDPLISESRVDFDPRGFIALNLPDDRTFFLKRSADLIVVGNDQALMEQVAELVSLGKDSIDSIDLSLGGSDAYREKIMGVSHEDRDLIDFHVNLDKFFEGVRFDDAWKENTVDFSVMTAMDIFDPDFFRDLTGTVSLEASPSINARSEFHK